MPRSFMSSNLNREVCIDSYVPSGNSIERVFIMLHGRGGSWSEVENYFPVNDYADKYNTLVVMPAVENRFYIDKDGWCISGFLSDELPAFVCKEFNLPADIPVVLGGYSMGGYGAMLNGLKTPSRYSGIVSVSGAYLAGEVAKGSPFVVKIEEFCKEAFELFEFEEGKLPFDVIPFDAKRNPVATINAMDKAEVAKLPPIILASAPLDMWYESTQDMRRALERNGAKHVYHEVVDGSHDEPTFDESFRFAFDVLFGDN